MENFNTILERVASWFDQNQKYGHPRTYWRMHQSNSAHSKGKTLLSNYALQDAEASRDMLLESLTTYAPSSDKFIHIYLRSSKTDSEPVYYRIENPYQSKTGFNVNQQVPQSIGGVIQQGYTKEDMDKIVEERLSAEREKLKVELDLKILQMQHERDMQDMQAQIAGVAETNKSMFEKVLGLAEHPVIAAVLTQLTSKLLDSPVNIPQSEDSEDDYEDEDYEQGYPSDEQIDSAVIETLDKTFGEGEARKVLSELAYIAQINPSILTNLRPTLQGMIKQSQAQNK
jgi:hypothetical protein